MINNISILIKPASSACNMKCKYCFYFDVASKRNIKNSGVMSEIVIKKIIDSAFKTVNNGIVNFSFQGGEPTLASIDYFYFFINYVNYINNKNYKNQVNYFIQTNGLLIEEKWTKLFKNNNFLVGLSLDIIESIHDKFRVDYLSKATFNKVTETKKLFEKYSVDYNILTVLTYELSKYPKEVYEYIKKQNIKYIQFIPCLSPLNKLNEEYSIKPKDFASFYNTIFNLWKDDFINGDYYSVSFFDNIIPMIGKNHPPFTCGLNGKCQSQIVVENNGDVYPCDFYCEDKYKIGNILDDDFYNFINSKVAKDFINEKRNISKMCNSCNFHNVCGAGCKRMTKNMYVDNDDFCGLKNFIDTNRENINKIWESIKINY